MKWISVKEKPSPPMKDVLLLIRSRPYGFAEPRIVQGWNESTEPQEDPAYCSYCGIDSDDVTHWAYMPKTPEE